MKATTAELARQIYGGVRAGIEAVTPGLQRFGAEVGATFDQKVMQGASEAANSLFHQSNAFVLYGPGQNPNVLDHGQDQSHEQGREHEHEMSRER